ncbi:hypothetical protein FA15DRAFT_670555 [Coprinopsis marcescibilis]|uniref:Uncharacterized protein n=1 Tax=Coprinopsis marcescibilis TaxID=230819 RepID=A0A5C3KSC1_COPMA|nr:hypothetical protein FA15DRAFT_670555 [Coprinopsis marcescibilis]
MEKHAPHPIMRTAGPTTTGYLDPRLIITLLLALGAATCASAQYYSDDAQVPLQQSLNHDNLPGNGTGVSEVGFEAGMQQVQVDNVTAVGPGGSDSEVLGEADWASAMEGGYVDSKPDSGERLLFIRRKEETLEEYVARGVHFLGLSVEVDPQPDVSPFSSGVNLGDGGRRGGYDPENIYQQLECVDDGEVQVDEEKLVELYKMFLKSRFVLRKWETKRRELGKSQGGDDGRRNVDDDEVDLKEAENKSALWAILSRMYGELVLGVNGPL